MDNRISRGFKDSLSFLPSGSAVAIFFSHFKREEDSTLLVFPEKTFTKKYGVCSCIL